MHKLFVFTRRPEAQTAPQFHAEFLNRTAWACVKLPEVQAYTVHLFDLQPREPASRFLQRPVSNNTLTYDVAEEIWVRDLKVCSELLAEQERAQSAAFQVIEYERFGKRKPATGRRSPGLVQIPVVTWLPNITEEFVLQQWHRHVVTVRHVHPRVRRYVQNLVIEPLSADAPAAGGIATLQYASVDDYENTFVRGLNDFRLVQQDIATFIKDVPGRFVASEYVLKG